MGMYADELALGRTSPGSSPSDDSTHTIPIEERSGAPTASRARSPSPRRMVASQSARSPPKSTTRRRSRTPSPRRSPPPRSKGEQRQGTTCYVGNLVFEITEGDLREAFGHHGHVLSAKIVYYPDRPTHSKGYGFVTLEDPMAAGEAMKALDGSFLKGRRIACHPARFNDRQPGPVLNQSRYSDSRTRYHSGYRGDCDRGRGASPPPPRIRSPVHRQDSPNINADLHPPPARRARSPYSSYSRSPTTDDSRSSSRSPVRSHPSKDFHTPSRAHSPRAEGRRPGLARSPSPEIDRKGERELEEVEAAHDDLIKQIGMLEAKLEMTEGREESARTHLQATEGILAATREKCLRRRTFIKRLTEATSLMHKARDEVKTAESRLVGLIAVLDDEDDKERVAHSNANSANNADDLNTAHAKPTTTGNKDEPGIPVICSMSQQQAILSTSESSANK